MDIRRDTRMEPGWDCYNEPCKHTPQGNHGIHGDEFIHVVTTEILTGQLVALVLTISTSRYPATVSPTARDRERASWGTDLSLHVQGPKPTEENLKSRGSCGYTAGSLCSVLYTTALGAHELWPTNADPETPSEAVWLALEAKLKELLRRPTLFEQPDETWELRDARARLAVARKAEQEASYNCDIAERSFDHFLDLYLKNR